MVSRLDRIVNINIWGRTWKNKTKVYVVTIYNFYISKIGDLTKKKQQTIALLEYFCTFSNDVFVVVFCCFFYRTHCGLRFCFNFHADFLKTSSSYRSSVAVSVLSSTIFPFYSYCFLLAASIPTALSASVLGWKTTRKPFSYTQNISFRQRFSITRYCQHR